MNVLLPFCKNKNIKFQLEATQGCFNWVSSDEHLVQVGSSKKCSASCTLSVPNLNQSSGNLYIKAFSNNQKSQFKVQVKI